MHRNISQAARVSTSDTSRLTVGHRIKIDISFMAANYLMVSVVIDTTESLIADDRFTVY